MLRDYVGNVMIDTAYTEWEKPHCKYETIVVKVGAKGKPLKDSWMKPLDLLRTGDEAQAIKNHAAMVQKYGKG